MSGRQWASVKSSTVNYGMFNVLSKHSKCRSAVSSRFGSCVPVVLVFGLPVDWTRSSDSLTGSLAGRFRKLISRLLS